MELNRRLSKQLQVEPLKPGETATFELLNRYKKEPGREEPSCPELYAISKREMIFDPGANGGVGGNVMIENIIGFTPQEGQDGKPFNKAETARPEFIKGVITVNHEQNETYIFLMRSKKRIDNPFRKKSVKAIFRLRDEKKDNYNESQKFDLEWTAENIVRNGQWDMLRTIKGNLNKSPDPKFRITAKDDDMQGMKLQLIKMVKKYPKKVILASEDVAAKNRVYIQDGLTFNVLMFTASKSEWSMYNANAVKDKVTILTTVSPEKDKVDALLEHFKTTEGNKHYAVFVNILHRILKATA